MYPFLFIGFLLITISLLVNDSSFCFEKSEAHCLRHLLVPEMTVTLVR
jgi:hypothetical protein